MFPNTIIRGSAIILEIILETVEQRLLGRKWSGFEGPSIFRIRVIKVWFISFRILPE